jgi:hypothetical protein
LRKVRLKIKTMKQILLILSLIAFSQVAIAKKIIVKGKVVDEDKNPIVNVDVFALAQGVELHTKTDSLGEFEFKCLNKVDYTIRIIKLGYHFINNEFSYPSKQVAPLKYKLIKNEDSFLDSINTEQKIKIQSDGIVIYSTNKTDDSYRIIGKVVDDFGEPVMFATIALKQDGSLVTGTQTDFDGLFSFSNIAVGDYSIAASYVSFDTFSTEISINEGEKIEIELFIIQGNFNESNIIITTTIPIIELDNLTEGATFNSFEIEKSPIKN